MKLSEALESVRQQSIGRTMQEHSVSANDAAKILDQADRGWEIWVSLRRISRYARSAGIEFDDVLTEAILYQEAPCEWTYSLIRKKQKERLAPRVYQKPKEKERLTVYSFARRLGVSAHDIQSLIRSNAIVSESRRYWSGGHEYVVVSEELLPVAAKALAEKYRVKARKLAITVRHLESFVEAE